MPRRRRRTVREHLISADTLKSLAVLATALSGLWVSDARHSAQNEASGESVVRVAATYHAEASRRIDSLVVALAEKDRALAALRRRARMPDGPPVPPDWLPQPVKKKRFLGIF